jgi:hypothetical protein
MYVTSNANLTMLSLILHQKISWKKKGITVIVMEEEA